MTEIVPDVSVTLLFSIQSAYKRTFHKNLILFDRENVATFHHTCAWANINKINRRFQMLMHEPDLS